MNSSLVVRCRACRGSRGAIVLDLGYQPACDYFPPAADLGPDPTHPLQMWLCADCGLAQLVADPTMPEEPRAAEPAALVLQARDAVDRLAASAVLYPGTKFAEFGSPHGGSWAGLLEARGLVVADGDERADVVLDCFGLMHAADQADALAQRAARVAPGGVLLLQYHSLATIIERGQWTSLRHGHFAYYSTAALADMLSRIGFEPRAAWTFELYGGTVLLAATRVSDDLRWLRPGVERLGQLLDAEEQIGVRNVERLRRLQLSVEESATGLRSWLSDRRERGSRVLGYGAASRAVALLCKAGVDRTLLPAVADSAPGKQGRRMPGTDIPVVEPAELLAQAPDAVLLFLPDLLPEVRAALPGVEAAGAEWIDVETIGRVGTPASRVGS